MALCSLAIWLYLFFAHGKFWRSGPQLAPASPREVPDVDVIVPARDEAASIGVVAASLLAQDYPGRLRLFVVDDNSTDGTAAAAGTAPGLRIIQGAGKPPGWSGKLWALEQGVQASGAPILLFTDADIVHDTRHVSSLVARLQDPPVEMVSEMVRLNCASTAERLLVPAFVYFFQLLYPFAAVNDPRSRLAAASGGVVLIRRSALERIGGLSAIKGALIDDVTLAKAVKAVGPIYLGHSGLAASIRPYPGFGDIWRMVARTAFTQLRYSFWLLAGTLLGLGLIWLIPVMTALFARGPERVAGAAAFALGAVSYLPTLRRYGRNPLAALGLPLIATFYMAATVGSALNHWFGTGVRWKARDYDGRA